MRQSPTISASEHRRLFLNTSLLTESTDGNADTRAIGALIKRLGFVQLDTISIVERAHHHILWTRRHAYQPQTLDRLQRLGHLFEHFTHDASLISAEWFPHWRHRFERVQWAKWFGEKMKDRKTELLESVRARILHEGPLLARDFDDPNHQRGTWWDWKPAKAALEFLWRTGELAIPRREGFEKVYDLTERVMPRHHAAPMPTVDDHIDWACSTAMQRIGAGTASEIAAFWKAISLTQARDWALAKTKEGVLIAVNIETVDGNRSGFALPQWRKRTSATPLETVRLLSPFDPLIRDRKRCARLFGFDYRFEAFVPGPKRSHGYYVLPILKGDRFVGRLDPKLDRNTATMHILGMWWEPGVRVTRALRNEVDEGIERYALFCNARRVERSAAIR